MTILAFLAGIAVALAVVVPLARHREREALAEGRADAAMLRARFAAEVRVVARDCVSYSKSPIDLEREHALAVDIPAWLERIADEYLADMHEGASPLKAVIAPLWDNDDWRDLDLDLVREAVLEREPDSACSALTLAREGYRMGYLNALHDVEAGP